MTYRHDATLSLSAFLAGFMIMLMIPGKSSAQIDYIPDPMHPLQSGWSDDPNSQTGLDLQSILVAGDRSSAVINGQLLTIGSRIGNSHIIGIMHDAVIIRQNGQRKVLRLNTRHIVTRSRSQENAHE